MTNYEIALALTQEILEATGRDPNNLRIFSNNVTQFEVRGCTASLHVAEGKVIVDTMVQVGIFELADPELSSKLAALIGREE